MTLLKSLVYFPSSMPCLPLRLVFGWLLLVGPVRGWAQGVPHPVNSGNTGPAVADLTARAATIFEGRAVAYRAFQGTSGMIYTVATVAVYKVFKGAAAATVEVVTEGGTLPNGRGGGPAEGGVPLGNHATGLFFAVPFRDAAHVPRVPPRAGIPRRGRGRRILSVQRLAAPAERGGHALGALRARGNGVVPVVDARHRRAVPRAAAL
ncbi:hypothetical protein [Hymenobacter frigidus]